MDYGWVIMITQIGDDEHEKNIRLICLAMYSGSYINVLSVKLV